MSHLLSGIARVEYSDGVLRALISGDFDRYYLSLFGAMHRAKLKSMFRSRHGCHITIFDGRLERSRNFAAPHINKVVKFLYDPADIQEGGTQHIGYYLPIFSSDILNIRKEMQIISPREYSPHISLFTNKHFAG